MRSLHCSPNRSLQDPKSVHVSWATYFSGLDKGLPSTQAFSPPPGLSSQAAIGGHPATIAPGLGEEAAELSDHLKVQLLVRAYQVRGHHTATLDPLGIMEADLSDVRPAELELDHYGWTEKDLDKEVRFFPVGALGGGAQDGFRLRSKRKERTMRLTHRQRFACSFVDHPRSWNPSSLHQ